MAQDGNIPEYIRRAIYGEMSMEEKRAAVDKSTTNWWREYAARKNDEEEEHVADTLLYDERCHLPRTVPRPDVVPDDDVLASSAPQGAQQTSTNSSTFDTVTRPPSSADKVEARTATP
jgi:hypothetical protein